MFEKAIPRAIISEQLFLQSIYVFNTTTFHPRLSEPRLPELGSLKGILLYKIYTRLSER